MPSLAVHLDRLLTPSLEELDEGTRHVARLLPRVLLVGVLFVIAYTPLGLLLVPEPGLLLAQHGAFLVGAGATALLLQRGHVRLAGVLTVAVPWAHVTLSLWIHGGLQTPVLGTYFLVVLVAGLLFGLWGASFSVGACLASSLTILAAGQLGLLPHAPPPAPLRVFTVFAANLGLLVGLAYLAATEMGRAHRALEEEIVERRHAQQQRLESEARARSFVETSPMGILLYRLEAEDRLVLTGANPAADRILGLDHTDLIGQEIETAFPALASTDIPGQYRRLCTEGGVWSREEVAYEDEKISGVFRVHAFQTAPGQMATLFLDVTEKRREEKARRALEEQLRQSQKLEAVGRLAGGVAHDFNNLLMVISAHGELLRRGLEPEDPRLHKVQEIASAAERASRLVSQLLAFSRTQVLEPRVVDLNDLVAEVARMLTPVMGSGVSVVVDLAPGRGHVKVDPAQMERVLMNLAVNARDAMPEGGTLELRTSRRKVKNDGAVASCSYVVLSVKDTGVGMDAETRGRAFEPFFTTKSSGEGTGLGLAMAYGIVQQSGGQITLDSEPGRGSVFWISLPGVEEETSRLPPAAATRAPVRTPRPPGLRR